MDPITRAAIVSTGKPMSRPSIMRKVPTTKSRPNPSAQNNTRKTATSSTVSRRLVRSSSQKSLRPCAIGLALQCWSAFHAAGPNGERSAFLEYRVARLGDKVTQSGHRRIAVVFHNLFPRGDRFGFAPHFAQRRAPVVNRSRHALAQSRCGSTAVAFDDLVIRHERLVPSPEHAEPRTLVDERPRYLLAHGRIVRPAETGNHLCICVDRFCTATQRPQPGALVEHRLRDRRTQFELQIAAAGEAPNQLIVNRQRLVVTIERAEPNRLVAESAYG